MPQQSLLVPQQSLLVPQQSLLVPQQSLLVPQQSLLVPVLSPRQRSLLAWRYLNYRYTPRRPTRTSGQPRTSSRSESVTPCPEGGVGAASEPHV